MSWYRGLDRLEAIWEAKRMAILLSVGVMIAIFLAVSVIAGIARHYEELKR